VAIFSPNSALVILPGQVGGELRDEGLVGGDLGLHGEHRSLGLDVARGLGLLALLILQRGLALRLRLGLALRFLLGQLFRLVLGLGVGQGLASGLDDGLVGLLGAG
jgi:hypothetical protein